MGVEGVHPHPLWSKLWRLRLPLSSVDRCGLGVVAADAERLQINQFVWILNAEPDQVGPGHWCVVCNCCFVAAVCAVGLILELFTSSVSPRCCGVCRHGWVTLTVALPTLLAPAVLECRCRPVFVASSVGNELVTAMCGTYGWCPHVVPPLLNAPTEAR